MNAPAMNIVLPPVITYPPDQTGPPSAEEAKDTRKMPPGIAALPRCPTRGVPVPWFVAWIDGVPDFRVFNSSHFSRAVRERRCWVCGLEVPRSQAVTFAIGPMCGVNRTFGEPGGHLTCARWSCRNCPFLSRPLMERSAKPLPAESGTPAGFGLRRNPGVTLLWTCREYRLFQVPDGVPGAAAGVLFNLGDPEQVEWWAEGRAATRAEVGRSVETGLPFLLEKAREEDAERGGQAAERELLALVDGFRDFMPRH